MSSSHLYCGSRLEHCRPVTPTQLKRRALEDFDKRNVATVVETRRNQYSCDLWGSSADGESVGDVVMLYKECRRHDV